MEDVQGWPMERYPFKHPGTGKPISNYWKLVVKRPDGTHDFKIWTGTRYNEKTKQDEVVTLPTHAKVRMITSLAGVPRKDADPFEESGMTMTDGISPDEVRRAEEWIEGKPSLVTMGLWAKWENGKWELTDRKKVSCPLYWLDVTDKYFDEWRPKAYDNEFPDPYVNQKRPYTRIEELQLKEKEIEKENAALKEKLARLEKK